MRYAQDAPVFFSFHKDWQPAVSAAAAGAAAADDGQGLCGGNPPDSPDAAGVGGTKKPLQESLSSHPSTKVLAELRSNSRGHGGNVFQEVPARRNS